MTAAVFSWVSA